jgi:hydrogenase nickel incorporation protein HypA/HybF
MHELSVCQALLDQVEELARLRHSTGVVEINVEIGPLSGVEPGLLQQAFTIASAGTLADSARLVLTSMPVQVHCEQCDSTTEAQPARLVCGHCGNWRTRVVSGDELLLTTVELTMESRPAPPAPAQWH